ncbi:site-specific DNA-methyltransferase [Marivita cryptomonadis]|jgi:DNA modification methylase|uniref:site-specific DNA-methyltransferase n=2 Tax=Marivita TaxID=659428 RepID=UPI000A1E8058|nr:DNA methyltransferase [Marivita cryptomonadis]
MTADAEHTARAWPAAQVEMWQVADLVPYARNARQHPADQIDQIAASMQRFGFTIPMLVAEDGTIIAGHGRLMAAAQLGLAEVPVMVARGWTEEDRRLYTLADNRLAEIAEWDPEMLRLEIEDLRSEFGIEDFGMIGFSADDLAEMLPDALVETTGGLTDPDDVPELPETPVTRPGEVWILGAHRLLCGDSTVATDVEKVLGPVKPLLMCTDPPYGVDYDPAWRNTAGAAKTKRTGKVLNDDRADWREAWALFPGDVGYVWHGALHAATVAESLEACGFAIRSQIIWAKERLVLSRGDYHWQHEPCWYAVRTSGKGHWSGDRKQTTLWHISSKDQDASTIHGTQKPVACMRRPIENNSSPGQAVYEPFMGSGTTLIAAEMTGRVCYGIELNPAYVDVAITRWQDFTGEVAVLESTGQTFGTRSGAKGATDEDTDAEADPG